MDHKILIVDDDPQQRRYLSTILSALGYGVATSSGRLAAVELLAAAGYRSYLFSANPYVGPETGLAQGFERYENQRTPAFSEAVQALRAGEPA